MIKRCVCILDNHLGKSRSIYISFRASVTEESQEQPRGGRVAFGAAFTIQRAVNGHF